MRRQAHAERRRGLRWPRRSASRWPRSTRPRRRSASCTSHRPAEGKLVARRSGGPGAQLPHHRAPDRVGAGDGGSVSLEPLEMPARAIPAGRITPVRLALQNNGPAAAHVRLNTTDDSGKNFSRDVEIAPGASPAALTFSFANPGFHWAQVWLEGDAAPTGTAPSSAFRAPTCSKSLFVGGEDDFGAHALRDVARAATPIFPASRRTSSARTS